MMGKRILIIHHSLDFGGTETQLIHHINHLNKNNDVILFLYYSSALTLQRANQLKNVEVYFLDKRPGVFGTFTTLYRIKRIVKKQDIDVVITYLVGTNIAGLLISRLCGIKKIVWGLRVSFIEPKLLGISGRLLEYIFRYLSKYVDLIISNSYSALNGYENIGLRAKKHRVIPNGVDTTTFRKNSSYRAIARSIFGVSEKQLVIGCVARLVPWKGYETFLHAAKEFLEVFPSTKFIIIGSGDEQYVKSLNNTQALLDIPRSDIVWLGQRSDVSVLLNGFDIFCLLSTSGEALSNSLLEAMATKIPVVATNIGDSAHVVDQYGHIISARNPDALVDAWKDILNKPEETQHGIKLGVNTIIFDYNLDLNIERFCELAIQDT